MQANRRKHPISKKSMRRRRRRSRLMKSVEFLIGCAITIVILRIAVPDMPELLAPELFQTWQEQGKPLIVNAHDNLSVQKTDSAELDWLEEHIGSFNGLSLERVKKNAGLVHFLYCYGTGNYSTDEDTLLSEDELADGIPLLMQWDSRWGYDAYGDSVTGLDGCGPTCLAMVCSGLKHDASITPRMVARYAMEHDYYMEGTGTKWSLIPEGAEAFGINAQQIDTSEAAIHEALSQGQPVIVNVGEGHFTGSGHFLVLCGEKKGKYIIHDPNSIENSSKLWKYDTFGGEIRAAWKLG